MMLLLLMPHGTWTRDLDGWVEKKLSLSIQHFFLARARVHAKQDGRTLHLVCCVEVCRCNRSLPKAIKSNLDATNECVCVCVPDACTLWIIIIIHHTVFCCWWMHPAN